MSESGVYVVVVGHNLEAKCDVADALASQRLLFRPFSCRKKKVIKARKTVFGKDLYIVATPDLNTPSWTHLEHDLGKYKSKVFLYVQDNDCIDSDDTGSVKKVQKRFLKERILTIHYNLSPINDKSMEGFSQSHESDAVIFNQGDKFEEKCRTAIKIMKLINESLRGPRGDFKGRLAVDDRTEKVTRTATEKCSKEDIAVEMSILESVKSNVVSGLHKEEEEFKHIPLTELKDNDWILYRKTLQSGSARSNHVRVNIVGNQGAGKTTLVQRLQEIDVKCPDENQKPTEGIEINQATTRCAERDGVRFWETKTLGFEQELNFQRMAFALEYVKNNVPTEQDKAKLDKTIDEIAELEMGSEEAGDVDQVQKTFEYGKHVDIKHKEIYLQKVNRWKDNSTEERMYVSYWDFAGQSTYYATHQAFMAPSAVYVLVIDLSKALHEKLADNLRFRAGILKQYTVEETVKFWISSIKAYTRDNQNAHAPFIIVGTHKDKVTDVEVREKFGYLRKVLKNFTQIEFVTIDNTCSASNDVHLKALRNKILDLGLGVVDEEISAQWINLENLILQEKKVGKGFLSFSDIQKLDDKSDIPLRNTSMIEAFLEHEHRRGWLMHFCHVDLKDIIILDPVLLADYFNLLLRESPTYELQSSGMVENGRMPKDFVEEAAAKTFNVKMSDAVIGTISKLLVHLHIMQHFEGDIFFIPCLLPHREDQEMLIDSHHLEKVPTLRLSFADAYVPPAFFHLLIAALSEDHRLSIFKTNGTPRVYHLFTCFCYQRNTLWLEVYWHKCCILFDLKNYSEETSETESNTVVEVLKIIQSTIEHILRVYRQDNVKYIIEIECPLHASKFVNLHEAKEKGEVMCVAVAGDPHCVSWNSVNHFVTRRQVSSDVKFEGHKSMPCDKDLGRLARYLSKETALSLASKLDLPKGNIKADRAESEWNNSVDMQRLRLLCDWRETHHENSLNQLLEVLTKQQDYTMEAMSDVLEEKVKHIWDYGIDEKLLDSSHSSDMDLVYASECTGSSYTFLMLELGLTVKDIEVEREDNSHKLQSTINSLLRKWRQTDPDQATTRVLLDTIRFLGMDTNEIISKLKAKHTN